MAQGRLRRLITRRRVKWAGLVLCVLVLGVGVASAWYEAGWWFNKPRQRVYIGIGQGRLGFVAYDFDPPYQRLPRSWSFQTRPVDHPSIDPSPGWFTRYTFGPGSPSGPSGTISRAFLPLWLPLLLIAAPTAWLWYPDRRAKPWQCPKCRYDLRGLDGGVCPECGEHTGCEA